MTYIGLTIVLVILVYSIYRVVNRGLEMKLLAHKGVLKKGVVNKKFRSTPNSFLSKPFLRYEFVDANGKTYSNRILVSEEQWEKHEEGGEIEIVVCPQKPNLSAAKYMVNHCREALKMEPF